MKNKIETITKQFNSIGIELHPAGIWEWDKDRTKSAIDAKRIDGLPLSDYPEDNILKHRPELIGVAVVDNDGAKVNEVMKMFPTCEETFYTETSLSGKQHYYLYPPEGKVFPQSRSVKKVHQNIDVLTTGIVFEAHDYQSDNSQFTMNNTEIKRCTDKEYDLICNILEPNQKEYSNSSNAGRGLTKKEVKQMLSHLNIHDYVDRDSWMRIIASIFDGLGSRGEKIARNWSQGDSEQYDEGSFDSIWLQLECGQYGSGISVGTLVHESMKHGYGRPLGFTVKEGMSIANPDDLLHKLEVVEKGEVTKDKKALSLKKFKELSSETPQTLILAGLPTPKEGAIMVAGKGDTGKSFLTLKMAISYLEQFPEEKVLFWFTEDAENIVKYRISMMNIKKSITKRMRFVSSEITEVKEVALKKLKKLTESFGMTILDPLISFYEGEENSNNEAREFFNKVKQLSGLVVLIHHSSKGGETARGASDFRNGVRMLYKVETFNISYSKGYQRWTVLDPEKQHQRFVSVDKDNQGVSNAKKFDGISGENRGYEINLFKISMEKANTIRRENSDILEVLKDKKDEPPHGVKNVILFKKTKVETEKTITKIGG